MSYGIFGRGIAGLGGYVAGYAISVGTKDDNGRFTQSEHGGYVSWYVKNLIIKSSGWNIEMLEYNGKAKRIGEMIKSGIKELTENPMKYKKYGTRNKVAIEAGIGTIEETVSFYKKLLDVCERHPDEDVFVYCWN